MESDETRIFNAAHLMVASLAGSLAHVTCKVFIFLPHTGFFLCLLGQFGCISFFPSSSVGIEIFFPLFGHVFALWGSFSFLKLLLIPFCLIICLLLYEQEPLRTSILSQLRNSLQGLNLASELLEQAVQIVTNDNLDLGCAVIEQAATDKVFFGEQISYLFICVEN